MALNVVTHRLSLAIRFVDHFTGEPVSTELPVRLAGSFQRPVLRSDGGGRRQADGGYRFTNTSGGTVQVLWRLPFSRSHGGWVRWQNDPEVALPLADPTALIDEELWPAADAEAPASATGVRGKLTGPGFAGQTVRIALQGDPFDRFTQSSNTGEFLFLPPGRLPTNSVGLVPLSIDVRAPDGTARVVTGGNFLPSTAGAAFAGSNFAITPRTVPRIVFQLA